MLSLKPQLAAAVLLGGCCPQTSEPGTSSTLLGELNGGGAAAGLTPSVVFYPSKAPVGAGERVKQRGPASYQLNGAPGS